MLLLTPFATVARRPDLDKMPGQILRAFVFLSDPRFLSSLDEPEDEVTHHPNYVPHATRPESGIKGIRAIPGWKKVGWMWTTRIGKKDYYRPLTERGLRELVQLRKDNEGGISHSADLDG